jgi:hypothetical protein
MIATAQPALGWGKCGALLCVVAVLALRSSSRPISIAIFSVGGAAATLVGGWFATKKRRLSPAGFNAAADALSWLFAFAFAWCGFLLTVAPPLEQTTIGRTTYPTNTLQAFAFIGVFGATGGVFTAFRYLRRRPQRTIRSLAVMTAGWFSSEVAAFVSATGIYLVAALTAGWLDAFTLVIVPAVVGGVAGFIGGLIGESTLARVARE